MPKRNDEREPRPLTPREDRLLRKSLPALLNGEVHALTFVVGRDGQLEARPEMRAWRSEDDVPSASPRVEFGAGGDARVDPDALLRSPAVREQYRLAKAVVSRNDSGPK